LQTKLNLTGNDNKVWLGGLLCNLARKCIGQFYRQHPGPGWGLHNGIYTHRSNHVVIDSQPSTERLSVTLMFECTTFEIPKVPFWTIFGLVVTLTLQDIMITNLSSWTCGQLENRMPSAANRSLKVPLLGIAIPDVFSNPGISGLKNANPGIPGLNPGTESLIVN